MMSTGSSSVMFELLVEKERDFIRIALSDRPVQILQLGFTWASCRFSSCARMSPLNLGKAQGMGYRFFKLSS